MRAPDHDGALARVWRYPDAEEYKTEFPADCGTWLINGPFHPAWSWWKAGLVHLRPIEGKKPAIIHLAGATHEFFIVTVNPQQTPDPDDIKAAGMLQPFDVVQQFRADCDAAAHSIVDHLMVHVAAGDLSPDQDFRSAWERDLLNAYVPPEGSA